MKKIFLLCTLISGFTLAAQAQSFGIRAGANLANFSSDSLSTSNVVGFQVGPVLEFGLGETIAIDVAAMFSSKGAKDDSDVTSRLNYLEVPVLLHLGFLGGLYFEVGPSFGYLLSASADDDDISEDIKDFDMGAIGGVGFSFGSLRADLRYNLGMLDINDISNESIKNGTWTVGASIFF